MTGKQLRDTVQEVKSLGLSLNRFLYVNGNLKENQAMRYNSSDYTIEQCLEELERVRKELWWLYNDNQQFAESSGFGKFS